MTRVPFATRSKRPSASAALLVGLASAVVLAQPRSGHSEADTAGPRALWDAAQTAERHLDFDRALSLYRLLAVTPRYSRFRDPTSPTEINHDMAVLRAADLLRRDGQLPEAARLYRRFADEAALQPLQQRASALYIAGEQYAAVRRHGLTITVMTELLRRIGRYPTPQMAPLAVSARTRLAEAYEALGRTREAERAYLAAADDARRWSIGPGVPAAKDAARALFKSLEPRYQAFARSQLRLSADAGRMKRACGELDRQVRGLLLGYGRVADWQQPTWLTAAWCRMGEVLRLASMQLLWPQLPRTPVDAARGGEVYGVECPLPAPRPEAGCFGDSGPLPALEVRALERWTRVLEYAAARRFWNEWTALARSRLRDYRPDRYSAEHDAMVDFSPE